MGCNCRKKVTNQEQTPKPMSRVEKRMLELKQKMLRIAERNRGNKNKS